MVNERIVELVNNYWEEHKAPLLLANLGAALRREFDQETLQKQLLGAKLRQYIVANLAKHIRPVHDPADLLVWALVPSSVTIDPAELFAASKARQSRPPTPRVSDAQQRDRVFYDQDLWRAFTDASPAGRRYVQLADGRAHYFQVATSAVPPPGAILVEEGDVPTRTVDLGEWVAHVARAIELWAQKNDVNISAYKRVRARPIKTLLELVLDAIPSEEHRTTSLPLSIVRALLRPVP